VGLADELGDLDTAYALAKKMAGIKRGELVRYHRPLQYVGSPYAAAPASVPQTQINIASMDMGGLLAQPADGFYYLWPGFNDGH
jgi:ClpP class serine protease